MEEYSPPQGKRTMWDFKGLNGSKTSKVHSSSFQKLVKIKSKSTWISLCPSSIFWMMNSTDGRLRTMALLTTMVILRSQILWWTTTRLIRRGWRELYRFYGLEHVSTIVLKTSDIVIFRKILSSPIFWGYFLGISTLKCYSTSSKSKLS